MDNDAIFRICELGVFLLAVAGVLYRLGAMTERFELIGKQQQAEIRELKDSVKEIQKVVISQALQTQRLDTLDDRLATQGKRVDDLTKQVYTGGQEGKG